MEALTGTSSNEALYGWAKKTYTVTETSAGQFSPPGNPYYYATDYEILADGQCRLINPTYVAAGSTPPATLVGMYIVRNSTTSTPTYPLELVTGVTYEMLSSTYTITGTSRKYTLTGLHSCLISNDLNAYPTRDATYAYIKIT